MKFRSKYRRYLAATLAVGSTIVLAAPTLATPAGTQIKNTATAQYEDDDGNTFDATSNEVVVTVQEVAGLFVTSLSTVDVNGGSVLPNDELNFEFKVTNAGNDTTAVNIPQNATVSGPATQDTTKNVQIVGFIDDQGNRTTFTTPVDVTANASTDTLAVPQITTGAGTHPAGVLPAGYSYIVSIPVKVDNLASSGSDISVQLGDTGANDNTPGTQNQPNNSGTNDVSTKDAADATLGESAGAVGQEKEASASTTIKVGSEAIALATILKTHNAPNTNATPSNLSDDRITYNLALRVESNPPAGSVGVTAGKLVGTDITVDGGTVNRVLVSDAIPAQTAYVTGTATAPNADWTPVYTDTATSTAATGANWVTNPATLSNPITRVGFIYDATTTPIDEGTSITGFTFTVVTSGITGTAPTNITNLAQVFGQTQGNTGTNAPLVYDESGDQSPSNFNENGTPGPTSSLTPGSTNIPDGVSNPTNNGVDNNNDNTGTGPGGEDNVVTIAAPGQILNGPSSAPGAVGPTDNNDDFTNRAANVPAGTTPGSTIDPAEVEFTNTISNPSTTDTLTDLLLVPDAANFTPGPDETLPPTDTLVTLTYGGNTAVYKFNGTNFVFDSGTAITIPALAPSQVVDYTVKVDLPTGTPLSTDTEQGFSIPLYVFKDLDNDSRPDALTDEPTQNRTIDRVYTGFLKLTKQARIIDTDGTTEVQGFTTDSNLLNAAMTNGRFIEYKVTYKNISIAPVGTGNTTLNAKNAVITEDGDTATNTWAQEINGTISTSHVMNSVTATFGTTQYFPAGEQSGTTQATDVSKYEHTPGVVIQPQAQGDFVFRRKVN